MTARKRPKRKLSETSPSLRFLSQYLKQLRFYFFTGLLVWVPLIVTVWLTLWLFGKVRGGVESDIAARILPQMKTIANMGVAPDYPGQLAFLTDKRPLIGVDDTNWLQIGGHSMYTATSTQIADKDLAVNTVNKTLYLHVYDTTNKRIMIAQGTSSTSDWVPCDGGAAVTPS